MSSIRVLILAGKGESTRLMFNGIKDSFSVEKVIIWRQLFKDEEERDCVQVKKG